MPRMSKKILSMILTVAMLLTAFPVTAIAAEDPIVATIGETEYTDLAEAISAAITANDGVAVEIKCDIDLSGKEWTPVTYSGGKLTIHGNGNTITGLSSPLMNKTGSGGHYFEISNLTFDNAAIDETNEIKGEYNFNAVILPYADSMNAVTFTNVTVKNSYVTGTNYTSAFIGYAGGWNKVDDGPVYQHIYFSGCKVLDCHLSGSGSTGALMGHAAGNQNTNITVENTTVTGNTVTCRGTSSNKAGSLFGTVGAAGNSTGYEGRGLYVSATATDNTVTSNGTTVTTIYGRQGTSTGTLELTGGSYDSRPIAENDSTWAKVTDGYDLVEQGGIYSVKEHVEATIGTVKYASLAQALSEVKSGETIKIVAGGEYDVQILNGKNYTIDASKADGEVIFNHSAGGWIADCDNVTVKNITWNVGTATYQYFKGVNAVKCTFIGLICTHTVNTFTECTFKPSGDNAYCVNSYASNDTFENCQFITNGKAIYAYAEGASNNGLPWVVKVNNCSFSATTRRKVAVFVKTLNNTTYDVSINSCVLSDTNWPKDNTERADDEQYPMGANGLWGIEGADTGLVTVKLDGVQVYPELQKNSVNTGDSTAEVTVQQQTSIDTSKVSELDGKVNEYNTRVSGVELTTSSDTEKSGIQEVINAAMEYSESAKEIIESASDISVTVDVLVVPTEYTEPDTETVGTVTYDLSPVASVKVGNETVADNIPVSNDMIDKASPITVSIYTGFVPAKIVHSGEDGFVETFYPAGTSGAEKTFSYSGGICTMTIEHFSHLTAYTSDCVAKIGDDKYYMTLKDAIEEATSTDVIVLLDNILVTATDGIEIPSGKTVTIDLNGMNITSTATDAEGTQVILNNGNLTIMGEGRVLASPTDATPTNAKVIKNNGKIKLCGGTYNENVTSYTDVDCYCTDNKDGTYTVIEKTEVTVTVTCGDVTGKRTPSPVVTVSNDAKATVSYSRDGIHYSDWNDVFEGNGVYYVRASVAATATTKAAESVAMFRVSGNNTSVEIGAKTEAQEKAEDNNDEDNPMTGANGLSAAIGIAVIALAAAAVSLKKKEK